VRPGGAEVVDRMLKRAHSVLMVAAMALFATAGAALAATAEQASLTLLCYGDSLTAGYGLPAGGSYPDRLGELLRAAGRNARIVNAGVSGDTTAGGLARLDWTLAERPHAAILCLGANDALRGLSVERMEANLDAMLARFARQGVPVLLAGMKAPRNLGPQYAAAFEAVFPRLAAKHKTLFYPFLLDGVAADPALNLADGIHPNAAGAEEIARRILPLVLRLLDRAGQQAGRAP